MVLMCTNMHVIKSECTVYIDMFCRTHTNTLIHTHIHTHISATQHLQTVWEVGFNSEITSLWTAEEISYPKVEWMMCPEEFHPQVKSNVWKSEINWILVWKILVFISLFRHSILMIFINTSLITIAYDTQYKDTEKDRHRKCFRLVLSL